MQKSIPVFHFLQKVEMKDMETSSATSKLMVLECDEELQQSDKIMRKRNIGSVIMYSMIIAMMTLLSVNTVILEQKKKTKLHQRHLKSVIIFNGQRKIQHYQGVLTLINFLLARTFLCTFVSTKSNPT